IRDGHVTGVQTCALPIVDAAQAATDADTAYQRLTEVQQALKAKLGKGGERASEPQSIVRQAAPEPDTAVAADVLTGLNEQLLAEIGRASCRGRAEEVGER